MSWEVIAELSAPLVISYENDRITQIEEGHGRHDLSGTYRVMQSVKVYIGEYCVDITDKINTRIEDEIWQQINDMQDDVR
jgi:hypothetical protein